MASTATQSRARKGDVVVYSITGRISYQNELREHTRWRIGLVGSTTREGVVTSLRDTYRGHLVKNPVKVDRLYGLGERLIAPASKIDVDGMFADLVARSQTDWQADRFESLEAARDYVSKFIIGGAR